MTFVTAEDGSFERFRQKDFGNRDLQITGLKPYLKIKIRIKGMKKNVPRM